MDRIDAHQHFWQYNAERDTWITDEMAAIQRDFLPADLVSVFEENNVKACVAVQADQSEEETDFLLKLAEETSFIQGVVGWVDLMDPAVGQKLARFNNKSKLKGVRHIVQAETDPNFLLNPSFVNGIGVLSKLDLSYDILIKPHQLDATVKFVSRFGDKQRFVIDHLAKPFIAKQEREPWAAQMERLAKHENVYCKLSGMVTEASWHNWTVADFTFYIDHLLETFGPRRLMFGSDWPVCLVAAQYNEVVAIVDEHIRHLSIDEQALIWSKNATRFYKL
ncbi:amidohydrolase family protein [Olivibacter sp. SDN3]|uniref:amidohydrolase family protein n=1 Tax=Olivibacter sp. SDN3 TaxID=2764720 RepID=UPI001650DACC|nr:amidohydrolase family protein [Olivibacter sp. SDN3]QNL50580.1 amidohydrolase family protein [Olivibacter sp. SDN3]